MNTITLYFIAFFAGVLLAIQAGFNTQLSVFLKQPVLAAIATSVFSIVFASAFVLISGKPIPTLLRPDSFHGIYGVLEGFLVCSEFHFTSTLSPN